MENENQKKERFKKIREKLDKEFKEKGTIEYDGDLVTQEEFLKNLRKREKTNRES